MKKIIFLLFFLSWIHAFGGQNSYLSKRDAQRAVKYIGKNKIEQVVLWCGCCIGESKKNITVTKTFSRYTGFDAYYEVVIEGYNNSESVSKVVDLTSVWVLSDKMAIDLATMLHLESNPCSKPFKF